jgi:hypothetical protein
MHMDLCDNLFLGWKIMMNYRCFIDQYQNRNIRVIQLNIKNYIYTVITVLRQVLMRCRLLNE